MTKASFLTSGSFDKDEAPKLIERYSNQPVGIAVVRNSKVFLNSEEWFEFLKSQASVSIPTFEICHKSKSQFSGRLWSG